MNTKEFKLIEARFTTRFYYVAFLFPLLLVLFGCLIQPQEGGQAKLLSGWSKAKEAFDRLGRKPPSLAAREFDYSISCGKGIYCDISEMLGHIFGHYQGVFSNHQHKTIAMEILNGGIFATSSAVRMLKIVSSGWQKPHDDSRRQEVRECLVELPTVNPSPFLRVCYEEREDSYQ